MMKKVIVPFVGLVLGLFVACTNDSDSANSLVSGSDNSTVAKVESISYVASEGSCGGSGDALKKDAFVNDSVHLYMNKDGSAVLKEEMYTICWYDGKISNISLEKLEDTLLVFIDYYKYPQDTLIVHGSSRHIVGHATFKCGPCSADYEIDIPAEFVGSKFVSVNRSGKAMFYPIAYVKE